MSRIPPNLSTPLGEIQLPAYNGTEWVRFMPEQGSWAGLVQAGMPRRQFLRYIRRAGLAAVLTFNVRATHAGDDKPKSPGSGHKGEHAMSRTLEKPMMHKLPDLPYKLDALEPFIDEQTMRVHHDGHHAAYVKNLNATLEKYPEWAVKSVEELLKDIRGVPADIRQAVINNGGGVLNHNMFWTLMAPPEQGGGGEPTGQIAEAIKSAFVSFANFREAFTKTAATRFGSGWAWLSLDPAGKLVVTSTANQDSPLSDGHKPILLLDVWEHAYYLKYQNRRPEYIDAWWHVVNWPQVNENLAKARK
jgi:Fe-Mn family superoxide dismutase